jgi:hypothetical protein
MLKNLFKPTKGKLITDIVLAFLLVILLYSIPAFGFQKTFLNLSPMLKGISILISLLFSLIIYYPLTCSLVFIYKRIAKTKEKEKPTKLDFVVAMILILVWNPFTFGFIYSGIINYNNHVINHPCGVEIISFSENSPTRDAGLYVGDIIISADENNIDTVDLFMHAMANKRAGDSILLKTKNEKYNVKVIAGADGRDGIIGVKVKEAYCQS